MLLRLFCGEGDDAGEAALLASPALPLFVLQPRQEPLPPAKQPCMSAGYHPRKRVQRVGDALARAVRDGGGGARAAVLAPAAAEAGAAGAAAAPAAGGCGAAPDSSCSDGEPQLPQDSLYAGSSLPSLGDSVCAPYSSASVASDATAALAALLHRAPPPPLPLLAHVVGAQWRPLALTYAHGGHFREVPAAPPTAPPQAPPSPPAARAAAARAPLLPSLAALKAQLPPPAQPRVPPMFWRGFSLRSLVLSRAAEFPGLLSSGADGTVRAFGLRGELLGSLAVAAGFTAPPLPPPPPPPAGPCDLPSEESLTALVMQTSRAAGEATAGPPAVPHLSFWRLALDGAARSAALAASSGALDAALAATAAVARDEGARAASAAAAAPPPRLAPPLPEEGKGEGKEEEGPGPAAAPAARGAAAAPTAAECASSAAEAQRLAALDQMSAARAWHPAEACTPFAPAALSPREAAARDIAVLNDAARMGAAEPEEREEGGGGRGGEARPPAASPQAARRAALVAGVAARARAIAFSADDHNFKRDTLPPGAEDADDDAADGGGVVDAGAGAGGLARTPAHAAREAALAVTRAVVRAGALRPEATQKRVLGVQLTDAERAGALMRALERDERDTPNFFSGWREAWGAGRRAARGQRRRRRHRQCRPFSRPICRGWRACR